MVRISQAAPEAVPSPFIVGVRVSPGFLCPRAPRGTPERDPPTLPMTGLNSSFPFLRTPHSRLRNTAHARAQASGPLRDAPPPRPPGDAHAGGPIRRRNSSPTHMWPRPPSLRKGARAELRPEPGSKLRAGFYDGRRRLCCRFGATSGSLERCARTDVAGREGAQTAPQRLMLK